MNQIDNQEDQFKKLLICVSESCSKLTADEIQEITDNLYNKAVRVMSDNFLTYLQFAINSLGQYSSVKGLVSPALLSIDGCNEETIDETGKLIEKTVEALNEIMSTFEIREETK